MNYLAFNISGVFQPAQIPGYGASTGFGKLASATSTLTYAIIGLAVTILAFVILHIVQFFLKSSVGIT